MSDIPENAFSFHFQEKEILEREREIRELTQLLQTERQVHLLNGTLYVFGLVT
jgi:hypothetical protein